MYVLLQGWHQESKLFYFYVKSYLCFIGQGVFGVKVAAFASIDL